MESKTFIKTNPYNFVPLIRTPWAGTAISKIKAQYFPHYPIPALIGEVWEISTDTQFPSTVTQINSTPLANEPLERVLSQNAKSILGKQNSEKYGPHLPLLLKWIEASDKLSVQLHPNNSNPNITAFESGKPESWLVVSCEPGAYVYLGFQAGITKQEILQHIKDDKFEHCLQKYYPKPLDYISIPTGCVHALGAGVFVLEPQYVLPKKTAKTWRLSDWGRLYDEKGNQSPTGKPRELHQNVAISAIDWMLPQGNDLINKLVTNLQQNSISHASKINPFAAQTFTSPGIFEYKPLIQDSFSLISVWSGSAELVAKNSQTKIFLHGGESAIISAEASEIDITVRNLDNNPPGLAIFALTLTEL